MTFPFAPERKRDVPSPFRSATEKEGRDCYRIEILRSASRFAELALEWDALATLQDTPLALHCWFLAALDAQRECAPELATPLVWRGKRLVAAAPLMRSGSGPRRVIPMDAFAGEPDRILHSGPKSLLALANACGQLREPLLFRRLAVKKEDAFGFAGKLREHSPLALQLRHASSFVAVPESVAELERSMSSGRLSTIRRKRKMIEKEGALSLEVLSPSEDEVEPLVERFSRVENAGWKRRSGTSLMADPRMARFINQVARSFARSGDTIVSFLVADGRDAAGRIMLQRDNAWFELKIGFNDDFARFSPGIVHMHLLLCSAIERGVGTYHFLGVSEDWQNFWPHSRQADYRLASYPLNLRSRGALWEDANRTLGKLLSRG